MKKGFFIYFYRNVGSRLQLWNWSCCGKFLYCLFPLFHYKTIFIYKLYNNNNNNLCICFYYSSYTSAGHEDEQLHSMRSSSPSFPISSVISTSPTITPTSSFILGQSISYGLSTQDRITSAVYYAKQSPTKFHRQVIK